MKFECIQPTAGEKINETEEWSMNSEDWMAIKPGMNDKNKKTNG